MTDRADAGDPIPDVALETPDGGRVRPSDFRGRKLVLFFYPKDDTPGCTVENKDFSALMPEFEAAGATIIGVSQDSIARLNDFSADPDYCAGAFPVASDPDGRIARAYDLKVTEVKSSTMKDSRGQPIDHALTERTTFVIAPDSRIVATFSSADDKISPEEHVSRALAAVEDMRTAM